ncbi:MAG TPA: hypothetical protein VEJ18_01265 [Planctomycetota bacterium]|nr:hypothetical protein [Planctomycetota bacterium]
MIEPTPRQVHWAVKAFLWAGPVSVVGAVVALQFMTSSSRATNERGPGVPLKTIASAQADFRGNDRDGNRKQDYWRADIAGLYALKPEGADDAIKLIELSLAGADAAPTTEIGRTVARAPKAGYWVKALRHADESPSELDPTRFAAVMYPADGTSHRRVYIISEADTIFARPWNGPSDTPGVYPADPLKEGWSPLR